MAIVEQNWHLKLFGKSVAKQAKWRAIASMVRQDDATRGLDLGADNGVISYLLRERGGEWASADIDDKAVSSIRELVGEDVHQIDGRDLPFEDDRFNLVVVIDMLEHLEDDGRLVDEMGRVMIPGGHLVVNVPRLKRFSLLRPLRLALGLTDRWHGHVRPGYTLEQLTSILAPEFEVVSHKTYNRFFSELLDIILNSAYVRKNAAGKSSGGKGSVVTGADMARHEQAFRVYARLYPFMMLFTMLDLLAMPFGGYSLIVSAIKK